MKSTSNIGFIDVGHEFGIISDALAKAPKEASAEDLQAIIYDVGRAVPRYQDLKAKGATPERCMAARAFWLRMGWRILLATGGSVILAAITLKIGAYGFLRFNLPIAPDASHELAGFMITLQPATSAGGPAKGSISGRSCAQAAAIGTSCVHKTRSTASGLAW